MKTKNKSVKERRDELEALALPELIQQAQAEGVVGLDLILDPERNEEEQKAEILKLVIPAAAKKKRMLTSEAAREFASERSLRGFGANDGFDGSISPSDFATRPHETDSDALALRPASPASVYPAKQSCLKALKTRRTQPTRVTLECRQEAFEKMREQRKSTARQSQVPKTWRAKQRDFTASDVFEIGSALAILYSCATIVWDTDYGATATERFVRFIVFSENMVTMYFMLEWIWRFLIVGEESFYSDPLHLLDTFIVWFPGALAVWILEPFQWTGWLLDRLKLMRILRMLRFVRIVKVYKEFWLFRDVYLLVRGLWKSFAVLLAAFFLIMLILYVFAIIAVAVIGRRDCKDYPAAESALPKFQGLLTTMVTLVRFMHFDDSQSIMDNVQVCLPFAYVYFWLFIGISVFVLLNLLTAVIVNQAFESRDEDEKEQAEFKQQQRKEELEAAKQMFVDLDQDGSGMVTLDEIKDAYKIDAVRKQLFLLGVDEDELLEMFSLLDTDIVSFYDDPLVFGFQSGDLPQADESHHSLDVYEAHLKQELRDALRGCGVTETMIEKTTITVDSYHQTLELSGDSETVERIRKLTLDRDLNVLDTVARGVEPSLDTGEFLAGMDNIKGNASSKNMITFIKRVERLTKGICHLNLILEDGKKDDSKKHEKCVAAHIRQTSSRLNKRMSCLDRKLHTLTKSVETLAVQSDRLTRVVTDMAPPESGPPTASKSGPPTSSKGAATPKAAGLGRISLTFGQPVAKE